MKTHLYAYGAMLISIMVLDGIYLSLTMSRIYEKHLSHLLADKVQLWAVAVFYVLYAFGLYYVVVRIALSHGVSLTSIFITGMIFGMTAYGTYDLTNQATLKDWPAFITLLDIIWGGLMSGIACLAGASVLKLFK